jgi:hypothetical protein
MLPARLVAEMQRRSRDSAFELIDVVLVVERYAVAAGATVPWGRTVGVVCEQPDPVYSPGLPVVTGVPDARQAIADDSLVLIDGDRGVVLVDPDLAAIAAFQAEGERIAPRRRLHLDFSHQPARTASGRAIHVAALVRSAEEAAAASETGGDSLFLKDARSAGEFEADQTDFLLRMGAAANGKPITIAGDLLTISAESLLRAAARMELSLALPAARGAAAFTEARELFEEARVELTDQEADFGDVRLIGHARGKEEIDDIASLLIGRLILTDADPAGNPPDADWFSDLASEAGSLLIPVIAEVESASPEAVDFFIRLGASGLIVGPESVGMVKDAIREMD